MTVAVGDAVLAGVADVNGSLGLWGEERHEGMQLDQDAARKDKKKKKQQQQKKKTTRSTGSVCVQ